MGDKGSKKRILIDSPDIQSTNAIKEELKSFHQSILDHSVTAVTIEDGLNAMEVAHRILDEMSQVHLQ